MRTLYIDAATTTLFAGVMEDARWLDLRQSPNASGAMEELFELVQGLLEKAPLASMGQVALNIGPGRLLSLRIAATAANFWARNLPKVEINSLELLSAHLGTPCAYEVRKSVYLLGDQIVASISDQTPLLGSSAHFSAPTHPDYARSIQSLPNLFERLAHPTELFAPPTFAPIAYKKATNEIHSKESI